MYAWPLFIKMINIKNSNNRKIILLLITLLSLVLLTSIIFSFTFNAVDLTPVNATTVDNLVCTWNLTGSYDQINVTWYNNSVQFGSTEVGVSGSSTIDSSKTTRGQTWNCSVSVSNATTLEIISDKLTIINADPDNPDITNQTLFEDQIWSKTLTLTDPDGDSVMFICFPDETLDECTSTGYLEWTPKQADVGLLNFSFLALDLPQSGVSATIAFFNVTAVNDVPYFLPALSPQFIDENGTLDYVVTVEDEEDTFGPFNFSLISDYPVERLIATTSDDKDFTIQFIGNGDRAIFGDVSLW